MKLNYCQIVSIQKEKKSSRSENVHLGTLACSLFSFFLLISYSWHFFYTCIERARNGDDVRIHMEGKN